MALQAQLFLDMSLYWLTVGVRRFIDDLTLAFLVKHIANFSRFLRLQDRFVKAITFFDDSCSFSIICLSWFMLACLTLIIDSCFILRVTTFTC